METLEQKIKHTVKIRGGKGVRFLDLSQRFGPGAVAVARRISRQSGFREYVSPGSAHTRFSRRLVRSPHSK